MNDLKRLLHSTNQYQRIGFAILLLFVLWLALSPSSKTESAQEDKSADTYIPAGYVLVPIEVTNRDALESILGSYGVVDLYIPSEDPKTFGRKVASRVKILRAPLKPDEFAVLVRESDASQLVHNDGGYFVVIQNPKQNGTRLVKPSGKRSRITYENG